MDLPVMPPVAPMLARPVKSLPDTGHHEPKWDGFRGIIFKDGDEILIGSRNERPMTRYFPELVEAFRAGLPDKCVIDGEIVLIAGNKLDFDALQQRIHPAASRVTLLSQQTPASFVAFDILAIGDDDLTKDPFAARRRELAAALAHVAPPIYVTPYTTDLDQATTWFHDLEGAGFDGIISKPLDLPYQPDKRVMFKTKHERTADCVLAGYRMHKTGNAVGSLLLGLYDNAGVLHHVGVAASFPMATRQALISELAPLIETDMAKHPWGTWADQNEQGSRMPGAVSRWNAGKNLSFIPLRPERVLEVAYDHLEGDRFRHTTQFRRWRPDRQPETCTYTQLEAASASDISAVL